MQLLSVKIKLLVLVVVTLCSFATPLYADEKLTITNAKAGLSEFSPDKDGKKDNTAIVFTLNKKAKVTVWIRRAAIVSGQSDLVRTLVTDWDFNAGKRYVWWTGQDYTNEIVGNGRYRFIIKAVSGNEKVSTSGFVTVNCPGPEITGLKIENKVFSPDDNGVKDYTTINFNKNVYSDLFVTISNYKGVVRTLFDSDKLAGPNKIYWNGRDNFGRVLANGSYRLDIKARGSGGSTARSSLITINNPLPKLLDVRPTVSPFSPNGDRVKDITGFTYQLEGTAYVQVKVFDYKGEVKNVFSGYRKAGRYYELWNGMNNLGWLVPNGSYRFEIKASNSVGSVIKSGVIKIEGVVAFGPYSITVSVSARKLYLYRGPVLIKTYPVAVGMPSYPTPIGTYKIIRKDVNPTWYPPKWADVKYPVPYPKSPLGPRRLLLSDPSYGIHGTLSRAAIGKAVTHGCIRLYNEQIIELYNIIPVGTIVRLTR